MRDYWLLTKIQMYSLFGINRMRHTRVTQEKKRGQRGVAGLIALVVCLLYVSILYSGLIAQALSAMGQLPALLGTMALAIAALLLILSLFEARSVLFAPGDYDTLMSWPVSAFAVAASRATLLYAYHLAYTLLLMLPAGIIYGIYAAPAWWFYPLYVLLLLVYPALPTAVGALLGALLAAATARMKKSAILNSIMQILLIGGIMAFSFRMGAGTEQLGGQVMELQGRLSGIFLPARWFQQAALGDLSSIILVLLTSAIAVALLVLLVKTFFCRLCTAQNGRPKAAFRLARQKRTGVCMALYRKEWKKYLSSAIYLSNTAFGYVMLLAAGVVVGIVRPEAVTALLSDPQAAPLRAAVPLILCFIVNMSATTASSVSMEGKNLWIVKSMPVRAMDWLTAKAMVSLTMAVPGVLISAALIGSGLKSTPQEWVWLVATPLSAALLSALGGLWINLKLPKLDWKTDTEVVKQSGATMVFVLCGMAAAGIPLAVLLATGSAAVLPATTGAALLGSAILWLTLQKTGESVLYRL